MIKLESKGIEGYIYLCKRAREITKKSAIAIM